MYNQKSELIEKYKNMVTSQIEENISDQDLLERIKGVVEKDLSRERSYLKIDDYLELTSLVFYEIRKYGLLSVFLEDDRVSEVMINGYDEIYIERAGRMEKSKYRFNSREDLESLVQKIVGKSGREVNLSNPIVDTRLEDGSRVNIVLPPLALKDPVITVRKFPEESLTIDDLIGFGTLDRPTADFLEKLVKAKFNILIGGGTSSGKTTFLNVLTNFINPDERVITIEDSRELQVRQIKNLVSLQSRPANTANKGEVSIRDLIKSSLRMRPDRIIVGEVRSDETIDMLQAMNTGHDGSLSTAHANSTEDMISRLEVMILSGIDIPLKAIKQMIISSIDLLIHLKRLEDSSRKVMEISEIDKREKDHVSLNVLYEYDYEKGKLVRTENKLINQVKRVAGE